MKWAKQLGVRVLVVIVTMLGLAGYALAANGGNIPEKRDTVRTNVRDVVARLEKADPALKARIDQSAGYAAFTNSHTGMLMLADLGNGLAKSTQTGSETFMRVSGPSSGWGQGNQAYSVVFIFDTPEALANFTARGYVLPEEVVASSHAGKAEASPGVWIYQLDANGIAPALTTPGVKFYLDPELN